MPWVTCPDCKGRGRVTVKEPSAHGDTDTVLCARCNPDERKRMRGIAAESCGLIEVPENYFGTTEPDGGLDTFQTVILTLTDGRRVKYTGRAQIDPDDGDARVVGIEITRPVPLPDGCKWDDIKGKQR